MVRRSLGRSLPLRLRHQRARAGLRPRREARRRGYAHPLACGERREAGVQRLCGAGQHVALPHARPGTGGACDGETLSLLRRGQRLVGHRFHLVRLAAGPDPALSHLPDFGGATGETWLPADHAGAAREGVRVERGAGVRGERGGGEEIRCAGQGGAGEACLPGAAGAAFQDLGAEDAAGIPSLRGVVALGGGERQFAAQVLHDRGLAAAVRADQAIAAPTAEFCGDVGEQGLGPELHGDASAN